MAIVAFFVWHHKHPASSGLLGVWIETSLPLHPTLSPSPLPEPSRVIHSLVSLSNLGFAYFSDLPPLSYLPLCTYSFSFSSKQHSAFKKNIRLLVLAIPFSNHQCQTLHLLIIVIIISFVVFDVAFSRHSPCRSFLLSFHHLSVLSTCCHLEASSRYPFPLAGRGG